MRPSGDSSVRTAWETTSSSLHTTHSLTLEDNSELLVHVERRLFCGRPILVTLDLQNSGTSAACEREASSPLALGRLLFEKL